MTASDYVGHVGGYTQKADNSKIIVIHQNGKAELADSGTKVEAGDELMVLPKVKSKSIEITRGITQILYQMAVAAKLIFW